MISLNETNKYPITDPKEMEINELSHKEFKVIFLKKFRKLQEHADNYTKF